MYVFLQFSMRLYYFLFFFLVWIEGVDRGEGMMSLMFVPARVGGSDCVSTLILLDRPSSPRTHLYLLPTPQLTPTHASMNAPTPDLAPPQLETTGLLHRLSPNLLWHLLPLFLLYTRRRAIAATATTLVEVPDPLHLYTMFGVQ